MTLIKENHFTKHKSLKEFQEVLEIINIIKFPLHQRRVIFLEAKHKADPLEFVREKIENVRAAVWLSFCEESAICHLFLNGVKCEDSKNICPDTEKRKTQQI